MIDLSWMAGVWICEINGGTFEESWSTPVNGSIQGYGRHIVEEKVTFMEFLEIVKCTDKGIVMFIHLGALSKRVKLPAEFIMTSNTKCEAIFDRNVENDFPKSITYSLLKDNLNCVLTGKENGVDKKEIYEFRRLKH